MIDIHNVMRELSSKRPIFHSEADFQHGLAWEIHLKYPSCQIRLEYQPPFVDDRMYLDLLVSDNHFCTVIELKYITKKLQIEWNGEKFNLKNQDATDLARYDFIKDITRLEKVVANQANLNGYALLLANESSLWRPTVNRNKIPNDIHFRIHEGRVLQGKLDWRPNTGEGTKKGRESALNLLGTYRLEWNDFSEFDGERYGKFKFLLVRIESM